MLFCWYYVFRHYYVWHTYVFRFSLSLLTYYEAAISRREVAAAATRYAYAAIFRHGCHRRWRNGFRPPPPPRLGGRWCRFSAAAAAASAAAAGWSCRYARLPPPPLRHFQPPRMLLKLPPRCWLFRHTLAAAAAEAAVALPPPAAAAVYAAARCSLPPLPPPITLMVMALFRRHWPHYSVFAVCYADTTLPRPPQYWYYVITAGHWWWYAVSHATLRYAAGSAIIVGWPLRFWYYAFAMMLSLPLLANIAAACARTAGRWLVATFSCWR